jgi:hypothetical protein
MLVGVQKRGDRDTGGQPSSNSEHNGIRIGVIGCDHSLEFTTIRGDRGCSQ